MWCWFSAMKPQNYSELYVPFQITRKKLKEVMKWVEELHWLNLIEASEDKRAGPGGVSQLAWGKKSIVVKMCLTIYLLTANERKVFDPCFLQFLLCSRKPEGIHFQTWSKREEVWRLQRANTALINWLLIKWCQILMKIR